VQFTLYLKVKYGVEGAKGGETNKGGWYSMSYHLHMTKISEKVVEQKQENGSLDSIGQIWIAIILTLHSRLTS